MTLLMFNFKFLKIWEEALLCISDVKRYKLLLTVKSLTQKTFFVFLSLEYDLFHSMFIQKLYSKYHIYCAPVLCQILKIIVEIRTDLTSGFNGVTVQQGNKNFNKFKCCTLWVPEEQIEEALKEVSFKCHLEVSFKLRPKGSQKKGRECPWQMGKHVPDVEVRD